MCIFGGKPSVFMKPVRFSFVFGLLLFVLCFSLPGCNEQTEKEVENKKPLPPPPPAPSNPEPKKPAVHSTDEYKEEKVNLKFSDQDKKYLTLVDSFPLGSNSKTVREKYNLKNVRPEGGLDESAARGLTESKTKVTFLGKPADLELNFKNDSLYSFYYTISEQDFNQAERLYKGIRQYYIKKYGPCEEPVAEEETRHLRNCYWREKSPYGVMTYDVNAGVISWGFQNTKP